MTALVTTLSPLLRITYYYLDRAIKLTDGGLTLSVLLRNLTSVAGLAAVMVPQVLCAVAVSGARIGTADYEGEALEEGVVSGAGLRLDLEVGDGLADSGAQGMLRWHGGAGGGEGFVGGRRHCGDEEGSR
jgi:hypothetical protein